MENNGNTSPIAIILPKLDSLKSKISLQKSLIDALSIEFESTKKEIEALLHAVDSTNTKIDTTDGLNDSLNKAIDSSTGINESSSRINNITNKLIKSSKSVLNIDYYRLSVPSRMAKILNELTGKKTLTVAQMIQLTGASRVTITRELAIIKKLGWIKFNGSRNNGYFTLTEDGEKSIVIIL